MAYKYLEKCPACSGTNFDHIPCGQLRDITFHCNDCTHEQKLEDKPRIVIEGVGVKNWTWDIYKQSFEGDSNEQTNDQSWAVYVPW